MLVSVLLQILSDSLVTLLLILIPQFMSGFVIPLLYFHYSILVKFQLYFQIMIVLGKSLLDKIPEGVSEYCRIIF